MKAFDYFSPKTLEEALDLLVKCGEQGKLMAGGTDLLVAMKNREINPMVVVDLKQIPNLNQIKYDEEKGLLIGALVTIQEIELSPIIKRYLPILSEAASVLGSVQIRNKGTIGGNLCNASPAADLAPPLIALEGKVRMWGRNGERIERLEDLFVGPGVTILKADEILTEIQIPLPQPNTSGVYLKFSPRKAMDLAVVGVATLITLDPSNSVFIDVKIALGAVAPTPIRAKRSEEMLRGREIKGEFIKEVSNLAPEESRPISDIRSSAWARKEIIKVLVQRSITQAIEKIR